MRTTYALWLWDWNRGEALALKLRAQLGFYIQIIIYIGFVQLFFWFSQKVIDIGFQNLCVLDLWHKWNCVLTDPILQYIYNWHLFSFQIITTIVVFVTWNVKGSIDCSVLLCNVTLVLILSVILDIRCIMSVAEIRIMVTENFRGILVGNNIRPLNSWHPFLLQ